MVFILKAARAKAQAVSACRARNALFPALRAQHKFRQPDGVQ
jgi:hypothetical protein